MQGSFYPFAFCYFRFIKIKVMEKHINIVAALQIGFSILGLIIGGVLFTLFVLLGSFIDEPDAQIVFGIIAKVVMVVLIILSVPGIIAGVGLMKRKEWARILTLILSVLSLVNFPFGTAVGVYSIWALVQPEVSEQFKK
jgi:phage shock protein PspC (stress-responsive transcriptional regulator)